MVVVSPHHRTPFMGFSFVRFVITRYPVTCSFPVTRTPIELRTGGTSTP